MAQPVLPSASERPSRLPLWAHTATVLLIGLSFLSGAVLLYHELTTENEIAKPGWLHTVRVIHGSFYPFQCVLFGYLLSQHIRYGWQLKANRVSGLFMETCFAGLIITGLGLYYLSSDVLRERCQQVHSTIGVLLPVSLAIHWFAAKRWVQSLPAQNPTKSELAL
jgi:hypothetical protein